MAASASATWAETGWGMGWDAAGSCFSGFGEGVWENPAAEAKSRTKMAKRSTEYLTYQFTGAELTGTDWDC